MTTQFYRRYVPPSSSTSLSHGAAESTPKRRKLELKHESSKTTTLIDTSKSPKKKRKKKEKKKSNADDVKQARSSIPGNHAVEDDVATAGLGNDRHKKLRSRLERSTKLAERLSNIKSQIGDKPTDRADQVDTGAVPKDEVRGLVFPEPPPPADADGQPLEVLSEWIRDPANCSVTSKVPLRSLLKNERMTKTLETNGYITATPIQAALLPMLSRGSDWYNGDICIASGTGTGKTLAFMAPLIESLRPSSIRRLRGLVIVPTREVVAQTLAVAELCAAKSGLLVGTTKGSKAISDERHLILRKVARYDPSRWQEKYGGEFDPLDFEPTDEDASDTDFAPLRGVENYVPEYRSKVDVLICTPGRLVEHMRTTKGFTLDHVDWLVVDEMDRLLDQSYQDWTELVIPALEHDASRMTVKDAVLAGLPHRALKRRVRKVIASATITTDPDKLAALRLWRPRLVLLEDNLADAPRQSAYQIPQALEENIIPVADAAEKPLLLVKLLDSVLGFDAPSAKKKASSIHNAVAISMDKSPKPDDTSSSGDDFSMEDEISSIDDETSSSGDSGSDASTNSSSAASSSGSESSSDPVLRVSRESVLVFTAKNENAMRLTRLLNILRPLYRIGTFTGSSRSSTRRKTLSAFRRGQIRVLIASNLASRSLNIEGLSHVINYDIPTSAEMYVHRVGRTARAGKSGTALTLLAHHEARWFWREIGKGETIMRSRKVDRGAAPVVEEQEREEYQQALDRLGREARGKGE